MSIVVIGPPGAGKSTVGTALAARLGVPFVDTDAEVAAREGRSIAEIFTEESEAAFRGYERVAVAEALARDGVVVSLGGGAPMQPEIGASLAGRTVVFLDVTIRHAAGRIGLDASRPLLALNPRGQWTQLMRTRRPTYEALATIRIDTDGKPVDEVVDEIVVALEGRS